MSESRIRGLAEQIVRHPKFQEGLLRLVADSAVVVMHEQAAGERVVFNVPKVLVARADRHRRIHTLAASGMKPPAIAEALGVSLRLVQMVLKRAKSSA